MMMPSITSIPNSYDPSSLTAVNGALFFDAQTNSPTPNGDSFQLWKSDGTASGTTEVMPIAYALGSPVPLGSRLVFTEDDYHGLITVTGLDAWQTEWDVCGPATSQRIVTQFSRCLDCD